MFIRTFLLTTLLLGSPALASDGGSSGPEEPRVDLSIVPASAKGQPAGQGDDPHPVVARLLTEQASVAPGQTLSVGVHLEQREHWHTYWKTPGDIGLPTEITWTFPGGGTASDHIFPVPLRYDQDGMVSFGYDNSVLHIRDVVVPADLAPGTYDVKASASWLVCKTSCIPGTAELSLPVTVAQESKPGPHAPLFEHFRAQWPTPFADLDGLKIEAGHSITPILPNTVFQTVFHVSAEEGHKLTVPGADLWPTFTPIGGMDWMVDKTEIVPAGDSFFIVVSSTAFEPSPLPTDDAVGGLFQLQLDGETVRTEFTHPLLWASTGATTAPAPDLFNVLGAARSDSSDAAAEPHAGEDPSTTPGEPLPTSTEAPAGATDTLAAWSPTLILGNLIAAFFGGLILNVMPCVLPVLMLKLYGLVDQVDVSDHDKRTAGLAYTAGILSSFWVLAGAIWVIRTLVGNEVGWGFQMQYPGYVAFLVTLVFLFSLSLFGVFEVPAFGVESASELSDREGPAGYFMTGVFATLVATPCSAPILGTAIAFAFQAPMILLVLAFSLIGLGLAFPFLVIAFVPAAYRLLPQPGEWMEGFKQFIGFTLIATCVWLLDVFSGLVGADGTIGFLAFLTTVAIGGWIFGRWGGVAAEGSRQLTAALAGVAVMILGGWTFVDLEYGGEADCDAEVQTELSFTEHIEWQPFSEVAVHELTGHTLFVDFTADWCVSCKFNERTVLETSTVRDAMAANKVVPLVADWTRQDDQIGAWLRRYDRAGVPMYLVIPPSGIEHAILLPEVITPSMVVRAIEDAAGQTMGRL